MVTLVTTEASQTALPQGNRRWRETLMGLWGLWGLWSRLGWAARIGLLFLLVAVGAAVLSSVWTPHDAQAIRVTNRFAFPDTVHWLGTDQLGRDNLSQLLVGLRYSLSASLLAVLFGLIPGAALGITAAYAGGTSEAWSMRAVDVVFAFPAILTAILLTARFGPGIHNAIAAIALFNIAVFARVSRGAAVTVINQPYMMAARALGLRALATVWRHLLPNIAGLLIVQATIQLSVGVLAEAALSFLGLGVQPPAPSLGKMLSQAQTLIYQAPLQAVYPGAVIFMMVLAFNTFGDGLRDLLDPTLRRRAATVPVNHTPGPATG